MKARPILMSAAMIRALLDGRKTQTRRIVKPEPPEYIDALHGGRLRGRAPYFIENEDGLVCGYGFEDDNGQMYPCPYGKPGDLLWVRETFFTDDETGWIYKADGDEPLYIKSHDLLCSKLPWKPSIHMPRWASRLTLELTEVRVERLHDISEADAIAEGVYPITEEPGRWLNGKVNFKYSNPLSALIGLWCAINGQLAWKNNPWVWALSFRVHQKNVDALLAERARP